MAETRPTLHPKDKGWAWMIMIGAFVVDGVSTGYIRSFGVLFVAIQKKYDYPSGLISAVIGAQHVSICILNVLAMNVFIKKCSVRSMCIIGVLFQTTAVSLCNIIQTPVFLVLCLGFVYGIGQGLLLIPSRYMVSVYFHKRRSLAIIIASCGASVGGITLPIVTRTLLDSYGLQGALLMVAGIILNQLVFVIMYTPPSEYGFSEHDEISAGSRNSEIQFQQHGFVESGTKAHSAEPELRLKNDSGYGFSQPTKISIDFGNQLMPQETLLNSEEHGADAEPKECSQHNSEYGFSEHKNSPLQPNLRELHKLVNHDAEPNPEKSNGSMQHSKSRCMQNRLLFPADSSPNNSKCHLSVPEVFRSKLFWALLPCFIGTPVGTLCAYVFIPPLAVEKGLNGNAGAYLLTIASVTDIGGRLLIAMVLQMDLITASLMAIIPQIIGIILYMFTFIIHDYTGMLILAILYGPIGGFFFAIQSLLVIEVLGMPMLASAIGFYGAVMASSLAVSFTLGGSLQDLTGTYSTTFAFLAAMLLLGILSLIAVRVLKPINSLEKGDEAYRKKM